MDIAQGKQWELVTLFSIIDLGGSARRRDVLDNIRKREYIDFLPGGKLVKTLDSEGNENTTMWRNRVSWYRNKLVYKGCIDKSTWGVWSITEKGRHHLRELCLYLLDIDDYMKVDRDEDLWFLFLHPNVYTRARQVLGAEDREKELLEDYTELGGEEGFERLVKYIPRYRRMVDELKKKYENKCQVEGCGFTFRKKNGDSYSEGHHLIPLSEGGKQEESNVVVLCPNHHRIFHYANVEIGEIRDGRGVVKINGVSSAIIY